MYVFWNIDLMFSISYYVQFQMATKSNVAKPFITCLKQCQPAMSTFVFSKITNAFISLQRRQPHALAEMVNIFIKINVDYNNAKISSRFS